MTSSSYLTSEPSQTQVFSEWRTLFWKGIYTAMMTELQAVQYLTETILFCLEASIHFKICTWRQIIVNLKAKDYSFERYINSENRVVSLWYSIWRVESRGKKKYNQASYFLEEGTCAIANWLMLSDVLNTKNRTTEGEIGAASPTVWTCSSIYLMLQQC